MQQPPKYIPIEEKSKLYRIGRKRDLAELLGVSPAKLKNLTSDDNFKEWNNKTGRRIEEPRIALAFVLTKLHGYISKIETPDYLLSGKKKVRPRDNADMHRLSGYMVNIDIAAFYQSTQREFVYKAFRDIFGQTDDVASLLANLVTYKGHIPTGTATSQAMAFWAYRKTFDRIDKLCRAYNILMSVWVDDITFSSDRPFPRRWVSDIAEIMDEVDLALKTKKTKKYSPSQYKTATGSAISPDGKVLVKNVKRKEILDLIVGKKVENLPLKQTRQLFGKLTSQRQNEPHLFENIFARCKKHLQSLEKQERMKVSQK